MTPPQVTDGGDGLHARWTAANINNWKQPKIHTHPEMEKWQSLQLKF